MSQIIRVFALANKQDEVELELSSMASLLAKFRIDYSDLQLIPDITKKPKESTLQYFKTLIKEFRNPDADDSGKCKYEIKIDGRRQSLFVLTF